MKARMVKNRLLRKIHADLEGDPGLALPELQTAFWRMMVA
jgi:hypothetical protein